MKPIALLLILLTSSCQPSGQYEARLIEQEELCTCPNTETAKKIWAKAIETRADHGAKVQGYDWYVYRTNLNSDIACLQYEKKDNLLVGTVHADVFVCEYKRNDNANVALGRPFSECTSKANLTISGTSRTCPF